MIEDGMRCGFKSDNNEVQEADARCDVQSDDSR